jgi:hypothetical protein
MRNTKTKREKAIALLHPITRLVLKMFEKHPDDVLTANSVARALGLPINTVSPRLVELDERGYGFIRECPPIPGLKRRQKCWMYRGDKATLFNVTREGRLKARLDYRDLWLRERTNRMRLVESVQTKRDAIST